MMTRDDKELRAEVEARRRKEKSDAEAKKKIRKERGVVLRGKLIQMRDSMAADELFEKSQNSQ